MSAQYDLYETPDIRQTGEEQPLHPRIIPKGTISQDEFLDYVHKFTGMSRSLLEGALHAFQSEIKELLSEGWIVEFGDMGYFSVSLQGPHAMNKKEVHAQSISLKNVNFKLNSQFKKELGIQLKLERAESPTRPKGRIRDEEECLLLINDYLGKYPCMSRAAYCRMTGHDRKRALKELNSFIEQGILIRYGAGKQVVYARKIQIV